MSRNSDVTLVVTLDDPAIDNLSIGGKAAGLARLVRDGMPVPSGFVLSGGAFSLYLSQNELDAAIAASLSVEDALEVLEEGSWPEQLVGELEAAYQTLAGRPVAVRSSAVGEDGASASFAGQHRTVLNVSGLDAVRKAVLECWASLYSEEATQYRQIQGLEEEQLLMPVVVQELVRSDVSGVAFTVDPATGSDDVVVIEAAWGLGEGVVSGLVTPDLYRIRKSDGELIEKQVADQKVRIVAAEGGGVVEEELAGAAAATPALTDEQAVELARLAARIEAQAGSPQDIEWALADGSFAILQSRPVTGVAVTPPQDESDEWVSEFDSKTHPETIWTSANVQEVLPGLLSPFTNSVNVEALERYGLEPIERMGIKLTNDDPFFAFFYGRAFLNVTMMLDVIDQTPFASQEALMDQYLSQSRASAKDFDLTKIPHRPLWKRLIGYVRILPRLIWFRLQMTKDIKTSEEVVRQFAEEDAARPFKDQSDEELVKTFEDGLDRGAEVGITHVSGGGLTGSAFELLRTWTERWLDDEGGVLQAKLVTGLAGLESALPAFELWELSRLVLASDVLREAFDAPTGREIQRRVEALDRNETIQFRKAFAQFIKNHGHRSVMEAEAAALSWEEDLPTVYMMIRNYLHADPASSPHRIEERQRKEREEATGDARHRLAFWKKPVFNYALKDAQEWVAMREHTKSLLVRTTDRGRHLTREMARRLVERGRLDDVFDLYQLTWQEAKALFIGELDPADAAERIARRKKEDERNRSVVLPEMFRGRPKPLRPEEMALPDGHQLEGIAVSPGRITGKARVIMDPRRDATIEPGEILVAPVTDAGWTPLFVAAAGVVVDIGGTLSHGSTVAREYGLPAVVNVKHGTRVIKTGQIITVDGTRGVVVLDAR